MHPLPRFESSRRRRLSQAAVMGAALVLPGLACSSDEDVFVADGDTSVTATQAPANNVAATEEATEEAAVTEAPATEEAAVTEAGAFPAGAELVVDFTYAPSDSGGRVRNPYVAVWIETPDGTLVRTVSLWFEQSGKGTRWISDLSQWYRVSTEYVAGGGTDAVDVVSGATQVAGTYSVVWDGTDEEGNPVAQGDYVLYIESAREHGPHSITSATVTVTADGATVTLPDDGELSGAVATLAV